MSNKETTMNNRKGYTASILHAILRMLVCLMLLMACVPVAGETVSAADTYTEYGKLVFSASKNGVEQEDSDMSGDAEHNGVYLDKVYQFTTKTEGTMTLVYTAKNISSDYCIFLDVCDADTEESVPGKTMWLEDIEDASVPVSYSEVLSPGNYVLSSYFCEKTSGTISVYFLPTVNSIALPDATLQTGDVVSLRDVLSMDPVDYFAYCKSQATWSSDDTSVATVSKKGKVTAKSVGTATITMENPDGTAVTCTITVTDPAFGTTELTPTTVQLSKEAYTYNGKARKPKVTVLDQDGNEIPSDLVSVSYYNNTNAGTAKALVTVSAGTVTQEDGSVVSYHAATLTKTYTIKAATAKKVTVPKSSISYKYLKDGQKQTVTVYDSKGNKIDKSHYTVTYSDGAIHAGKVMVKVKMDKNYGSKTLKTTYTIKASSKTTKLFPKGTYYSYNSDTGYNYYYYHYAGETSHSFSYTKMSTKNLKKLLPYGDKDVAQDKVFDYSAYADRTIFVECSGGAMDYSGQSLKFTGTIGDLIQCCVQREIKTITYLSSGEEDEDVFKMYEITCKDGTEYTVKYNGERCGIKNNYIEVTIYDGNHAILAVAYIQP